jgi:putative hydrolase of the HAD superfamily
VRPAAVVLDYGNVLSRPQPAADRARIEALAGLPAAELWPAYWAERPGYDRGVLDGAGYWARVGERLGRPLAGPVAAELVEADAESWSHLDPVMVDWAAALAAAGVRTALLSNAPAELRDLIVGRFAWAAGLDQRTFSCDVGAVKPEAGIYEHCLAGLGVEPAQTLLVDDRSDNVDGAVRVGMGGLVFTTPAALAADLRPSGLPLPAA